MNYIEYGNEHKEAIMLLHGGGLSWWNYRETAKKLSTDYRVILPILDGHSKSNCDFISIEKNAAGIIDFIDEQLGGEVLLIGGLSLGGQIALEILSQRKQICRYALIESALAVPSKFTHSIIKPVFGSCYGLIKRRWFAALQFKSLRINRSLFEDYFRDTCDISKENMISFLEASSLYRIKSSASESSARVYVVVGEKENSSIQKSAKIISGAFKKSSVRVMPNMRHGEFSINCSKDYSKYIREIIEKGSVT